MKPTGLGYTIYIDNQLISTISSQEPLNFSLRVRSVIESEADLKNSDKSLVIKRM